MDYDYFYDSKLHDAADEGDLATVQAMFEAEPRHKVAETPFGSWLDVAAQKGQLLIVVWLLEIGLDVNRQEHNGSFPICSAALSGNPSVVRYLLEKGAVIRTDLDDESANPMFAAMHGGSLEVAQVLLDNGLDSTRTYKNGKTVMNWALLYGHDAFADLIATHQADGDLAKKTELLEKAWAIAGRQGRPQPTRILPSSDDLEQL
jgi:uncharacterized protein